MWQKMTREDDLGLRSVRKNTECKKKTFKYYFGHFGLERETQIELVYRPVYYLQFYMMKKINVIICLKKMVKL